MDVPEVNIVTTLNCYRRSCQYVPMLADIFLCSTVYVHDFQPWFMFVSYSGSLSPGDILEVYMAIVDYGN